MIEEISEIIKRLEEINKNINNKNINYAIDFLKLALREEEEKVESKCRESFLHYLLKCGAIKGERDIKGIYVESKGLKLQKYGYRPDVVLIKDDEVIFIEAEVSRKNFKKKIEKIKKFLEKIHNENFLEPVLKSIVSGERKLRIIFITKDDIFENFSLGNVKIEIYKMMNNPVSER